MIEAAREVTRVRIDRSNSSRTLFVSMRTADWVSAAHSAAGTRNRAKRIIDRQDIGTHNGDAMKRWRPAQIMSSSGLVSSLNIVTKRAFLKLLAAMASPAVSALSALGQTRLANWAGNLTYSTDRVIEATSVEQVRTVVRAQEKMKALGTRHCFNSIADSRYALLSLKAMHEVIGLDEQARTVTVEAGTTYGQLGPYLDRKGYALHNLASLPHISIAGACSTATHGSGEKNGNLATLRCCARVCHGRRRPRQAIP